ncbi:hypothetical protein [Streptomyces sp. NPDC007088]|uniref:hypothetical protein n=1 Tax=Streptomyces sp. NPDC007088 TaxID=3364773 RepID=UPI003676C73F
MKHAKHAKRSHTAQYAKAAAVVTGAVLAAGAAAPAFAAPAPAPSSPVQSLPVLGGTLGGLSGGEVHQTPLDDPQVGKVVHSVEQTGGALLGQLMAARAGGHQQGNAPMVGGLPLSALPLSSPLG